jgi:hypothetical protein
MKDESKQHEQSESKSKEAAEGKEEDFAARFKKRKGTRKGRSMGRK